MLKVGQASACGDDRVRYERVHESDNPAGAHASQRHVNTFRCRCPLDERPEQVNFRFRPIRHGEKSVRLIALYLTGDGVLIVSENDRFSGSRTSIAGWEDRNVVFGHKHVTDSYSGDVAGSQSCPEPQSEDDFSSLRLVVGSEASGPESQPGDFCFRVRCGACTGSVSWRSCGTVPFRVECTTNRDEV